jgi:uncharacterized protein YtpQ (UPF0354 family)
MNTLPDEILQEIFSYLDPQSIINVSYMNKRINHLAKDTKHFKNNDTIEVDTDKYNDKNINDINNIVAKIESIFPYIQLKIYLVCADISDISLLGNVKELKLYACRYITDFSVLGKQEILYLFDTYISDISHLGNVKELYLGGCINIKDFSILGKQKVLDLSHTNISDISRLSNVKKLSLSGCQNITDFSVLGKQEVLFLNYTNISDVSNLGNVKKLYLLGCINITDYTPLKNVFYLQID